MTYCYDASEPKRSTSIRFDVDILERIERVKGRFSRSAFVNNTLDQMLTIEEKRLEIV